MRIYSWLMMGFVLQNLKPPSYQTRSKGLSDSEGPLVDHSSKKGKAIVVPITTLKGRLLARSLEAVVTRNMGKHNTNRASGSGRESPPPPPYNANLLLECQRS